MAWYKPSTWFKKSTPTQTSTSTTTQPSSSSSSSQTSTSTYFGTPSSPFSKPGTYITPSGPVSSGGGSAYSGGGGSSSGSSGGGSSSSNIVPSTTIGGFAGGNIDYNIATGQINIKDTSGKTAITITTNPNAPSVNYGISSSGGVKIKSSGTTTFTPSSGVSEIVEPQQQMTGTISPSTSQSQPTQNRIQPAKTNQTSTSTNNELQRYSTVEPYSKQKENFFAQRTKIGGALDWLGAKASAFGYKASMGGFGTGVTPYQPEATSFAFGTAGRIAPYFIPVVGGATLAAESGEYFVTSKGRDILQTQKTYFKEEKGYPDFLASTLTYGPKVAGVALGSYTSFKQAETLLGYPKYSTSIVGTQQKVSPVSPGTERVTTDVNMFVTKKGLFSNQQSIATARTTTDYVRVGDKFIAGESKSVGLFQPIKGYEPIKGTMKLGKVQEFSTLGYDVGKLNVPTTIKVSSPPLSISKTTEATFSVTKGKGVVGTNLFSEAPKVSLKSEFVGRGGSLPIGKETYLISGRTAIPKYSDMGLAGIQRQAQGTYSGVVKVREFSSFSFTPSASTTPTNLQSFTLSTQTIRPVADISRGVQAASSSIISTTRTAPTFTPALFPTGMQYTIPKQVGTTKLLSTQAIITTPRYKEVQGTILIPKTITAPRQKAIPSSASFVIPTTISKQTPSLISSSATIPALATKTASKAVPGLITPIPITAFPPPTIIPFALPLPLGTDAGGGLGRMKASRKYSYIPSFKAIVFGIRGKGKAPASSKVFSGLETRPIYKGGLFGGRIKTKKKRR